MPSTLIFHKRDETFQAQRRLQTMSETEKAPLMDSEVTPKSWTGYYYPI